MANKKTQREWFNEAITLAEANGRDDMADFFRGRIEVLDKKTASRSQTKNQEANETIKEIIIDTLRSLGSGTVSEVRQANEELSKYENQKISALMRQLKNAEKVTKTTDKKKSIFSLAEGV